MRHWTPTHSTQANETLVDMVQALGEPGFEQRLLGRMHRVLGAASFSVYRAAPRPALFISGSLGVPDTTRDCWRAYLSGPHRRDRSLRPALDSASAAPIVCHASALDLAPEHRARVYEAHGVAERVSVVQREDEASCLSLNFYRHEGHLGFSETQLETFTALAPVLLALTRKHLALAAQREPATAPRQRLAQLCSALTPRELDVCERLLAGMTQDGVAADLGLSTPSVKTYRSRAFARLGIRWRSQLSALLLGQGPGQASVRQSAPASPPSH